VLTDDSLAFIVNEAAARKFGWDNINKQLDKEFETKEIKSLLKYLIKHNEDHAIEIMGLAQRAQSLGNTAAYENIVKGVDLLGASNESLRAALVSLDA